VRRQNTTWSQDRASGGNNFGKLQRVRRKGREGCEANPGWFGYGQARFEGIWIRNERSILHEERVFDSDDPNLLPFFGAMTFVVNGSFPRWDARKKYEHELDTLYAHEDPPTREGGYISD